MIKQALTVAAAVVFGLAACAPSHQPPGSEGGLLAIQRQLSESEEKIDQLSQRVTMIQIIVDSHQRALQDLDDSATANGMDVGMPPASPVSEMEKATSVPETAPSEPPPVSETKTAPVISQTSSPVSEMEKAASVSETAPSEPSPEPPVVEAAPVSETTPLESSPEPRQVETAQRPETEDRLMVPEPNPQYQEAMEIFRGGDYEAAAGLFETFAKQFPKNDLADNALYWSGECRYTRKDYTGALKQFRQVIEDYPSGSKVPDALLKIGFAHLSLGDKESAATYLKKVVAQYPFSTAGSKAEERLKTLQK